MPRSERWSRFPEQNGGLAKVDSGFDYAANFSSFACIDLIGRPAAEDRMGGGGSAKRSPQRRASGTGLIVTGSTTPNTLKGERRCAGAAILSSVFGMG